MAKGEGIPKTNPSEIENLIEQMIFGKRTERYQAKKAEDQKSEGEPEKTRDGQPRASGSQQARRELSSIEGGRRPGKKGHGRRAASGYSGAKVVNCRHEDLKPGDACPDHLCGGRLYDLNEPKGLLQFTGQPLITVTHFKRELLRCAKCQQRYVAPLPEGIKDERYDATCDATIALMRYGGGLPWRRQVGLQAMGGIPLGEATMWERCEATADAAMGIFLRLKRLAAGGEVMHTDDTWVRILSCLKEERDSGLLPGARPKEGL